MIDFRNPLRNGFGERLKQARKELRLSQTEFAEKVGIGRIAQFQYEKELRSPNVRYLCAASEAGIDIGYVLFGVKSNVAFMSVEEINQIEKHALSLISRNEAEMGRLDDEQRFVMFNLIKTQLIKKHTDLSNKANSNSMEYKQNERN